MNLYQLFETVDDIIIEAKYSLDRDINRFVTDLLTSKPTEWTTEPTRGHTKLKHKSGIAVPIAFTPSDRRALDNFKSAVDQIEKGTHPFCIQAQNAQAKRAATSTPETKPAGAAPTGKGNKKKAPAPAPVPQKDKKRTNESVELNESWVVTLPSGEFFVRNSAPTSKLEYATVFKSKDRAEAQAKRSDGEVESYYGAATPKGSKDSVAPKQNPVNKSAPYRSI